MSAWQAHKEDKCDKAVCFYCDTSRHPGRTIIVHPFSVPSRPKLGKAATRAMKRLKVKMMKEAQA